MQLTSCANIFAIIFLWGKMAERFNCVGGFVTMMPNVPVLLKVGYIITFSSVLQRGFVLLMKLRTFAWLYLLSRKFCWK